MPVFRENSLFVPLTYRAVTAVTLQLYVRTSQIHYLYQYAYVSERHLTA